MHVFSNRTARGFYTTCILERGRASKLADMSSIRHGTSARNLTALDSLLGFSPCDVRALFDTPRPSVRLRSQVHGKVKSSLKSPLPLLSQYRISSLPHHYHHLHEVTLRDVRRKVVRFKLYLAALQRIRVRHSHERYHGVSPRSNSESHQACRFFRTKLTPAKSLSSSPP